MVDAPREHGGLLDLPLGVGHLRGAVDVDDLVDVHRGPQQRLADVELGEEPDRDQEGTEEAQTGPTNLRMNTPSALSDTGP